MISLERARALRRTVLRSAFDALPTSIAILRGPSRRRRIALTFDDGPDDSTRAYLDILDRFSARATFFLVGRQCEARRDDMLEIVRRGHEVASHGFSHRPFTKLDRRTLERELQQCLAVLPPARTARPLVRPPRGATSPRTLLWCALAGFTTVLWSVNSDDWCNKEPREVGKRLHPDRVRPGDIVLLHEGQAWTIEALPEILGSLKSAGYEMVTVGEMLSSP